VSALAIGVAASLIAAALWWLGTRLVTRPEGPSIAGGKDAVWLSRPGPGRSPEKGPPMCLDPGDGSVKASLQWLAGSSAALDIELNEAVIRFDDSHDRAVWRDKDTPSSRRSYLNERKEYVLVFKGDWQPATIGQRGGSIAVSYRVAGRGRQRFVEIRFSSVGERKLASSRLFWVWRYESANAIFRFQFLKVRWVGRRLVPRRARSGCDLGPGSVVEARL
jgi:hypothetical protein